LSYRRLAERRWYRSTGPDAPTISRPPRPVKQRAGWRAPACRVSHSASLPEGVRLTGTGQASPESPRRPCGVGTPRTRRVNVAGKPGVFITPEPSPRARNRCHR